MTPQETQKQRAKMVKQMMATEGFKIVSEALERKSKELTNQLLDATDLIVIQGIQAEIKAIRLFINNLAHYAAIQG